MSEIPESPDDSRQSDAPDLGVWFELRASQQCLLALKHFESSGADLQAIVMNQIAGDDRRASRLVPALQSQIDWMTTQFGQVLREYLIHGIIPPETLNMGYVEDIIYMMNADAVSRRGFFAKMIGDGDVDFEIDADTLSKRILSAYADYKLQSDLVSSICSIYEEVLTDDLAIVLERIGVKRSRKLKKIRDMAHKALDYFGIDVLDD